MISLLATHGFAPKTMVQVPGGHVVPAECIVSVLNRGVYNLSSAKVPEGCDLTTISSPLVQIYAADVEYHSSEPLTSFTADWEVPPLPSEQPKLGRSQVVYFWPGFKAAKPDMGYPVLQPVLQYGERGPNWELQSWFVDGNDRKYPVATAPAIEVSPGDKITSSMKLDGKTWTVHGANQNTGEDSTLSVQYEKAGDTDYDWAMLVNENINVDTECSRMPAASKLTFTNVAVNGASPKWTTRADCAGNPKCDCGNAASVADNGDVTISWHD